MSQILMRLNIALTTEDCGSSPALRYVENSQPCTYDVRAIKRSNGAVLSDTNEYTLKAPATYHHHFT